MVTGDVIRRKLAAGRLEVQDGAPGADRGWRLALARAANDDDRAAAGRGADERHAPQSWPNCWNSRRNAR